MGREVLRDRRGAGFCAVRAGHQERFNRLRVRMVGIDPGTGQLAGPTIQEQTRQALANCSAVLEAGNATLDDVLEVGVLLTHSDHFIRNERRLRERSSAPTRQLVTSPGSESCCPTSWVSIRMTAVTGLRGELE